MAVVLPPPAPEPVPEQRERQRARRLLLRDGVCSMSMAALQGGPFLAAFALALGASTATVGFLASAVFVGALMQLPGLVLVERVRRRRLITVLAAGASRLAWVPIILVAIDPGRGVVVLAFWVVASALIGGLPAPAWNSLVHDIVPPRRLGDVFARRLFYGTLLGGALTLAGGFYVDWYAERNPGAPLTAYAGIFAVGLAFGLAGLVAIARLPEPAMPAGSHAPLRRLMAEPLADKNFGMLLRFTLLWTFAVNMAAPFFVVYMIDRLDLSLTFVTALLVLSQVANVASFKAWGSIIDRFSNKSVLAVAGPMLLFATTLWTFTTLPEPHAFTVPLLIAIHVLSGVSSAGVVLASSNVALKLSPAGSAHTYMTAFGLANAVAGTIAPIVGGLLAALFAARELSFDISWSEPGAAVTASAINLESLDFLFVFTFIIGLWSLKRLARVKEEGEIEEREVLQELVQEIVGPVRNLSTVAGLRRLAYLPAYWFVRGARQDQAWVADADAEDDEVEFTVVE